MHFKDVLRKHWKSCRPRLIKNGGILDAVNGGKRKQACDRCAERKRACDKGFQCATCNTNRQRCTYERLSGVENGDYGTSVNEIFPPGPFLDFINQSLSGEAFGQGISNWSDFADTSTFYGSSLLENYNPSDLEIPLDFVQSQVARHLTKKPPKSFELLISFTSSIRLENIFNLETKKKRQPSAVNPLPISEVEDHTSQCTESDGLGITLISALAETKC
jgi:hypothetical protein